MSKPRKDFRSLLKDTNRFPATIPEGKHPIPSRTRKLSPPGPMVLQGEPCGRVGRRREIITGGENRQSSPRLFLFWGRVRCAVTLGGAEGRDPYLAVGRSSMARCRPK